MTLNLKMASIFALFLVITSAQDITDEYYGLAGSAPCLEQYQVVEPKELGYEKVYPTHSTLSYDGSYVAVGYGFESKT